GLLLLSTVFFQPGLRAQSNDAATLTSGTLNLVIANKNGIVVAADSRMSSDAPFPCGRALTLHCDNSQKRFRTGSRSAMVIAGFAVGRWGSPLDLSLASLLRNRFGVDGRREPEGGVRDVEEWARYKLEKSGITQVADAILSAHYPTTDPVIQTYYRKMRQGRLSDISLREIESLAKAVLRETEKFTTL